MKNITPDDHDYTSGGDLLAFVGVRLLLIVVGLSALILARGCPLAAW